MSNAKSIRDAVKEDVWIKSSCNICFNMCAIRVHRVDGVVVNINLIEGTKGKFGGKEIYGIGHQLMHPVYMSIIEKGKVKNIAVLDLK